MPAKAACNSANTDTSMSAVSSGESSSSFDAGARSGNGKALTSVLHPDHARFAQKWGQRRAALGKVRLPNCGRAVSRFDSN